MKLRRTLLPILAIAVCTFCLWSSLCGTSDVTDDPSKNGGYNRGAVLYLQTPIAAHSNQHAHPLPLPITDPSDIEIPAGCRLQVVQVRSLYGMFAVPADNIPRMSATARFLDGPLAGATLSITGISARTPNRGIKLDPAFLKPLPPPPPPASNPISLKDAMDMLRLLPETQSLQATLTPYHQSLTVLLEPPAGDQLQLSINEGPNGLKFWNRFRISPSGTITIWQPADDSWIDLPTWRRTSPQTAPH